MNDDPFLAELKERFSEYSSEYLLTLRARGENLTEGAHRVIEEIFAERGEKLPPRPTSAIPEQINRRGGAKGSAIRTSAATMIGLLALVSGNIIAQHLKNTFLGLAITAITIVVYIAYLAHKSKPTISEQKEAKKIEDDGVDELMICAANGNLNRLRELVAYGWDVDAQNTVGATALMYAVRNNQLQTAQALLTAGANIHLRSEKGLTALDIARKFGGSEMIGLLESNTKGRSPVS